MIADTDVLIDYVMEVEPGATLVERALAAGELATTVITRFELQRGARRARHPQGLADLLAQLEALPLLPAAADRAAEISRRLAADGQGLDRADCLIAGIVIESGETLLTRNRRHFSRAPGLHLADAGPSEEVHGPDTEP